MLWQRKRWKNSKINSCSWCGRRNLLWRSESVSYKERIDITIGDKITPRQTDYDYAFMITDKSVLAKKRWNYFKRSRIYDRCKIAKGDKDFTFIFCLFLDKI